MFYCIIFVFVFTYRDKELLNRGIVQYHFTNDKHEVLVCPHDNPESHIRTMPSTHN